MISRDPERGGPQERFGPADCGDADGLTTTRAESVVA